MTPERWRQIEVLFHAARERPVEARAAFLAQACAGDALLQREVEVLLAQPASADGLLDLPVRVERDVSAGGETTLTGQRLDVYLFQQLIGVGGMGEVYRARDTKLGRDVAIKILPRAFSRDAERLARFEREARVLASLNHPNIGAIYGLEEVEAPVGSGQILRALVLELVEGETLADRIRRGPVPLAEALGIVRQMADALDAAHERGIVHRDLKPANVAIRSDGTVKILDFGLAKALTREGSGADLSALPPAATATSEGLVVGTPTYMSPEQARGRSVDKRTDMWAFGCVFYELLTGRPTFPGETISDTIAAVLEREPNWTSLPGPLPSSVSRLLKRCLEKDPKRRLSDIADARLEIEDALTAAPEDGRRSARFAWMLGGAIVVSLVALATGAIFYAARRTAEIPTLRFTVSPPDRWRVNGVVGPSGGSSAPLTVSPDGRVLAFVGRDANGRTQLWVRALDTLVARQLAGTEGASSPFWSPDSRWIGFFADGQLKKIDATGGPPFTLCEAIDNRGGTWSRDGVIVFAPDHDAALQRVSAEGGVPTAATTLASGETGHDRPSFLPDGRRFLYTVNNDRIYQVYVASLDSVDRTLALEGIHSSNVVYVQGHLLYARGTTLMAQPLDLDRLVVTGDAVPIVQGIQTQGNVSAVGDFATSATGLLVYQAAVEVRSNLEWVDRARKPIARLGEPADYAFLELSPNGSRAAVSVTDPAHNHARDLWLFDLARGVRTRLTSDSANENFPVWSPDGSRLLFTSDRSGGGDLHMKATSGTGPEEPFLTGGPAKAATSWSPDGRYILYQAPPNVSGPNEPNDLWLKPLTGGGNSVPFVQTPFGERRARFSPDGRWVAYESNESGKLDVWVRPFPPSDGKWLISPAGGTWPRWRRDGKEIFYVGADSQLMGAEVNGEATTFRVGPVHRLFQMHTPAAGGAPFDVSADGQRFLLNTLEAQPPAPITVVVNWVGELKK